MADKKRPRGRPASDIETDTICFRLPLENKEALQKKFGKGLNKVFNEWVKMLIAEPEKKTKRK